ncbi:3'-5' exonuclease [Nocardia panacis]|uniref:3'-5' exonuclease n=1 Tax=Nocardia panacis TaxID=2340916 RepID=A0A3A4L8H2_9NOCA|nr:exonuclease domain-containing protein [Nocardia panacis]RJO79361.1 3'-5' exonuclease [Nocardia panacis]
MSDWTNLNYVVVDVEGNGQQPPDLVELAAVPITDGVIGSPVSWLVQPETPITPIALRIHGITNAMVSSAPDFGTIAAEVRDALDMDCLIAHNAHVDVGVLQRKLGEWECPEVLDTLKLARRLLPGADSYKLGGLVTTLKLADGLPDGLTLHRATYDALVTARLFVRLVEGSDTRPLTLEELRNTPAARDDGNGTAALF